MNSTVEGDDWEVARNGLEIYLIPYSSSSVYLMEEDLKAMLKALEERADAKKES